MRLFTAEEARVVDYKTEEEYELPLGYLMENAGRAVADLVRHKEDIRLQRGITFFCGVGNNGGDALVAARHLLEASIPVQVIVFGNKSNMTPLFKQQYKILQHLRNQLLLVDEETSTSTGKEKGLSVDPITNTIQMPEEESVPLSFFWIDGQDYAPHTEDIIDKILGYTLVDGLIGTGLHGSVHGLMGQAIQALNDWRNSKEIHRIVAIDVPSGLYTNTGRVSDLAVQADYTVTFGNEKVGMHLYPGKTYCGQVCCYPLGIPGEKLLDKEANQTDLVTASMVASYLPKRLPTAHKGTNGHVGLIAGSKGMLGAARMALQAALRIGAGKVTSLVSADCIENLQMSALPEAMAHVFSLAPLSDLDKKARADYLNSFSALAIGPGLGRDRAVIDGVLAILSEIRVPLVLDADGLYALGQLKKGQLLSEFCSAPLILTPHPGEFSRLSGLTIAEIESDRLGFARRFAKEHACLLVLKGAPTVIAEPNGQAYINSTGNAGMGTGGMGDTLTGILVALLAQGVAPVKAALAGVYLHGYSADRLAQDRPIGYLPSDVAQEVPKAWKDLLDKNV